MASSISIAKLNYSPGSGCRTALPSSAAKLRVPECFNGAWLSRRKQLLSIFHPCFHQKPISNVINSRVASLDVSEVSEEDDSKFEVIEMVDDELRDSVEYIRMLLSTMDDGRISVSPYDTAFVALIKDIKGEDCPQFPSALEWIAQNQLHDGSWGDEHHFCAYDRLVNTLACVVALRSWNVHPLMCEKGIYYINENVDTLQNADAEHMTCGFEVIFPALLQRARKLGIDNLPYDAPVITEIYNARDQKLKRIPKEMMYKEPTSLLFSLEGFEDLDWEKLLKLQSVDGSFLTSPSSTAFAFMETQDENCLRFITNTVQKLNGAPHTYPVDVFARLWAVDRLQRLGVSRYFASEIKDILDYIESCWTPKGVFSGRDSEFCDIDDTSMGFRLLRLHGYDVDPSVLQNFKSGSKFSCYGGQIIESSSPIYNLYRASQLQYPGENILEAARDFSYNFLQEKLANNQLLDKWVISKHLPDEIRKGLEMPWYSVLPRVEARYYLQYYAGGDDVWIGKTLYRMEEISNNKYLELARLDFQRCQIQHQIEWFSLQEWYGNSNLQDLRISRKDLLIAYFLAASSIFEPERSRERMAWAKSQIICRVIKSFFIETTTPLEQKTSLLKQFESIKGGYKPIGFHEAEEDGSVNILLQFLVGFNRQINKQLKAAWGKWLMKLQQGEANSWEDAELLVTTLNICAGHTGLNEDILSHPEYRALSNLTNKICRHLFQVQSKKILDLEDRKATISGLKEVEHDMQALVKLVLKESGLNRNIKQTFLSVVKSYYYSAYNDAETIDVHIFKVLFEPIV